MRMLQMQVTNVIIVMLGDVVYDGTTLNCLNGCFLPVNCVRRTNDIYCTVYEVSFPPTNSPMKVLTTNDPSKTPTKTLKMVSLTLPDLYMLIHNQNHYLFLRPQSQHCTLYRHHIEIHVALCIGN